MIVLMRCVRRAKRGTLAFCLVRRRARTSPQIASQMGLPATVPLCNASSSTVTSFSAALSCTERGHARGRPDSSGLQGERFKTDRQR